MKKLYVTIDTEMDSDIHWKKHFPPEYSSILEGIPKLLRPIWDKYQVHPVYFVSPEVLYEDRCCDILKAEVEKGAVIGAHLHPEYIKPNSRWEKGIDKVPAQFPCYDCSFEEEYAKLKNLTQLILEKLGVQPVWYRAARFGADEDTVKILGELGYRYDSSVTPLIDWSSKGGPDHRRGPGRAYDISKTDYYRKALDKGDWSGVREYPVTITGKRLGVLGRLLPDHWLFYAWLRPTHMTYMELKHLIKRAITENRKTLVMMFHSMEIMINKTPYVRNRWMQKYYLWRLEKIISYSKTAGYEL